MTGTEPPALGGPHRRYRPTTDPTLTGVVA
jgi:hypothetical protein